MTRPGNDEALTFSAAQGPRELAQSVSHNRTSTTGLPTYAGTREAWAYKVLDFVRPTLKKKGIEMPAGRTVRVGVLPLSRGRLGMCHSANRSSSGTVSFIGICTRQADPADLVHVLIHEYLHACDDCQSGHRNRWARWAAAIGMGAKGVEHRSDALAELIDAALAHVGTPAAHEPSIVGARAAAVPSQQRLVCPLCQAHAYVPMKLAREGYFVSCGHCKSPMNAVGART